MAQAGANAAAGERVAVRDATPADVEVLVHAIRESDRGQGAQGPLLFLDQALGGAHNTHKLLMHIMLTDKHDSPYHISHFGVAEVAGRFAGCYSAFPSSVYEQLDAAYVAAVSAALGVSEAEAQGRMAADKHAPWEQMLASSSYYVSVPGRWVMDFGFVAPAFRGSAVMPALITHMLRRIAASGATRVDGLVLIGNERSLRSLKKLGWRVVDEVRSEALMRTIECRGAWIITLDVTKSPLVAKL